LPARRRRTDSTSSPAAWQRPHGARTAAPPRKGCRRGFTAFRTRRSIRRGPR
jgi:hypothetical protein